MVQFPQLFCTGDTEKHFLSIAFSMLSKWFDVHSACMCVFISIGHLCQALSWPDVEDMTTTMLAWQEQESHTADVMLFKVLSWCCNQITMSRYSDHSRVSGTQCMVHLDIVMSPLSWHRTSHNKSTVCAVCSQLRTCVWFTMTSS